MGLVSGSSIGSFEGYLASLRKDVLTASVDELTHWASFFLMNLERMRFIILKLDSFSKSMNELGRDLDDERRWSILFGVCEVELKRRGCPSFG